MGCTTLLSIYRILCCCIFSDLSGDIGDRRYAVQVDSKKPTNILCNQIEPLRKQCV